MIKILFLLIGIAVAEAIVCEPDFCDGIECKSVTCPPGKAITRRSNCDCCGFCAPLQVKGGYCLNMPLRDLSGNVIQNDDCGPGLKCDRKTRKCVKK
ncbi:uncharacterized protein TNCV_121681 [Trichonephila clavipes]|nr:uncharacterized protein TNCV_121681 [Trichonephila clavipes]